MIWTNCGQNYSRDRYKYGKGVDFINKRKTGGEKEKLAGDFLKGQGYEILGQNFYTRFGEIDLILKDKDTLVFAEVKYRKDGKMGHPLEAVDVRKQQKISRAALYYIARNRISPEQPVRFDVVAVMGEEIFHVKNAFEFQG